MNLQGKTSVIAGATGGLGSELVKALDVEGVRCILISKSEDKLRDLIGSLQTIGHTYYAVDFSNQENITKALGELCTNNDKVDVLFNAMGVGVYKGVEEVTFEEWDNTLAINLTAPFVTIKKLMPLLKKSENPTVVNIGSGLGREIYWKNRIAYIASKFGLRGMSLALSKDYESEKFKFSYIALGSMLTNFGPGGLEKRLEKQKEGKKYFTPAWVAEKLIDRIKNDKLEDELVLYPDDYTHEELKIKD